MGSLHDVLFVGTSHGRLLKISSNSNTLIEAIQVFLYHVPVRNILVSDSDQIIILSHFLWGIEPIVPSMKFYP